MLGEEGGGGARGPLKPASQSGEGMLGAGRPWERPCRGAEGRGERKRKSNKKKGGRRDKGEGEEVSVKRTGCTEAVGSVRPCHSGEKINR